VTAEFLTARRSIIADAAQRRREAQAEQLAEWDSVQDVATEMQEATQAVDGEVSDQSFG
jgi:hypothetical protein